ncbi:MAG: DUF2306 domain-containing protein [Saprospiraceae bacterium]|nr:DUF2306 domain-containing protein [Saprospiraceae bacterium]
MPQRFLFFLFAFFAIVIGLYPGLYFMLDREFGLLSTKDEALLQDIAWKIGFYTHIIGGGLALLIGWTQFKASWRAQYPRAHRRTGKLYLLSVLLSGSAGVYIGFSATGGPLAASGFISLGLIWLYTSLQAYRFIRRQDIERHRRMMIYSYAACFAAVTLRLWLPLLVAVFQDFIPAYRIVAWLCWVPNLLVAHVGWVARRN